MNTEQAHNGADRIWIHSDFDSCSCRFRLVGEMALREIGARGKPSYQAPEMHKADYEAWHLYCTGSSPATSSLIMISFLDGLLALKQASFGDVEM